MSKNDTHLLRPYYYRSQIESATKDRHQRRCSEIEFFTISEPIKLFEFPPTCNAFRIQFNLHKSYQIFLTEEHGICEGGVVNHKDEQVITFPRSSTQSYSMIVKVLRSMGVPEHEQPSIIAKIYEVVFATEQQSCEVSINVDIYKKVKPILSTVEKLEKEIFERSSAICLEDFEAGVVTTRLRCLITQYTKYIRDLKPSAQECLATC